MSLENELGKLRSKAENPQQLLTEEATKFALVMPLIKALGYDVFDHNIVVPEFTADVGIKKGEKVDFAIKVASKISILIEAKAANFDLSKAHASQLYRYFSVTDARFGCLTNGVQWWFFTDLDAPNKMDAKPFFRFDITNFDGADLAELQKFSSAQFSVDGILSAASDMKLRSLIADQVRIEMATPSEEFVRLIGKRVYQGNMTNDVRARFGTLLAEAFRDIVREQVRSSLSNALAQSEAPIPAPVSAVQEANDPNSATTTEEELEGFRIIRAIAAQKVDPLRVAIRDAASYCAILLDDNNRRPIARLYITEKRKRIGLFKAKIEERLEISRIEEIYTHAARIIEAIDEYG